MLDRPYVIYPRRPFRCLLLALLTMVLTASVILVWGQKQQHQQLEQLTELQSQHAQLLAENRQLLEENRKLQDQLTNVDQMQALQQATDNQLQAELRVLQDKVIELNKELLFYQNITQGNVSSELQVRELHLRPIDDDPSTFMYRIVLTQGKRITKAIKGEVLITLNLAADDKTQSRLVETKKLNIRHVQVLEGTLKLAENEQPDSLRVMLRQSDKTLTERTFKWEVSPSPAS
jgi:regulator of replication initiation timing